MAASADEGDAAEPIGALQVAVEAFVKQHPAINAELLLENARVALAAFHPSPALFQFWQGDAILNASVSFGEPDPRSAATLERERFVEFGAVVMAGLCLSHFEGKQITRVVGRGSKVDYFVGNGPGDFRWILEVAGTDWGSVEALRSEKRTQLKESHYYRGPSWKEGRVSITRFAPQAVTTLDDIPSARG